MQKQRRVKERKRGVKVRKDLTLEQAHFVVATGEDLYLKMLLLDNLMHADLVSVYVCVGSFVCVYVCVHVRSHVCYY